VRGIANPEYRAALRAAAAAPYSYYGAPYGKAGALLVGATGGAWAFRRSAFDAVGGLLDTCILGSADWHMAFGLAQAVDAAAELKWCSKAYLESVLRWQKRAAGLKQNIGYVENHAVHYFHGSKMSRAYGSRWRVLRDNDYDPRTDISRDWQGVYQLNGNKSRLRDQIRAYFRDRNEDSLELSALERHLV
jgi:GNAT superfamily N-acetyltransferase